ncbi:hypothetical protein L7F22_024713 [Adiantum nelumboides]|nr:hypothetical protein [Adiantum nelumboides]
MSCAGPLSWLLILLFAAAVAAASPSTQQPTARKLALVPTPATILSYHNGPLLTRPISLYFLWYGSFTPAQKAILSDFASSLSSPSSAPAVSSWWSTVSSYTDLSHTHVTSFLSLAAQASTPSPSPPTTLKKTDILSLLLSSLSSKTLPLDSNGLYFVFTADDVPVEGFCMNSCGFHSSTPPSPATQNQKLTYAWVGNPASQCPGYCAWPYALPQFGPQTPPLVSPNKDVGIEGMVINMATVLAGAATNPFNTGFYQGDAGAPLEAASACTGAFGKGSYPGYPGSLLTDKKTGASYNARGVNGRLFLLPALWSPGTKVCTPLS